MVVCTSGLIVCRRHTPVKISVRQNAVRTSLDFHGLLLVFVDIMTDKVIIDHKIKIHIWSYLVSFENFHFFQFLAKIGHK